MLFNFLPNKFPHSITQPVYSIKVACYYKTTEIYNNPCTTTLYLFVLVFLSDAIEAVSSSSGWICQIYVVKKS
jgi:hypothetical protein